MLPPTKLYQNNFHRHTVEILNFSQIKHLRVLYTIRGQTCGLGGFLQSGRSTVGKTSTFHFSIIKQNIQAARHLLYYEHSIIHS